MLRRLSGPLQLSEASLLVCRPALNAPVLNVDFLPVGPARGALVLFAEEYGGIGLALGLRSVEGGQVAVFRNQEPIDESAPFAEALEPALATAERMGFLFDDDLIAGSTGSGRAEAMGLWAQLMGEEEPGAPAEVTAPDPAAASGAAPEAVEASTSETGAEEKAVETVPELVLDEVASVDLDDWDDFSEEIDLEMESPLLEVSAPTRPPEPAHRPEEAPATPVPPAASEPAAPLRKALLSKFRQAAQKAEVTQPPAASEGSDSGSGSTLARIALKRVRRGRVESRRMSAITRLLSSF